ncbi:unnamed protein product [Linum trigynum]|uniref:ENT domain-containing protein n=1 Tax=Linum trigynum TaxID=586398 RepID=A0AAV2GUT2_9ROSI
MRFKSGSKVEVLEKRDSPSGWWRCAEIVCGNGHNYSVRYDGDAELKRISRNAIRPCPPAFEVSDAWVPGDVVEVFDDCSWKIATITKAFGDNYLVRVLGSSAEFKVSNFCIRARQSWQGDKWVVIGKGNGSCKDRKPQGKLSLKKNANEKNASNVQLVHSRKIVVRESAVMPGANKGNLQKPNMTVCKNVKRGAYGDSQAEAYYLTPRKYRAVERGGRPNRLVAANKSSLCEEVLAIGFPSQAGFSQVDAERRQLGGAVGCSYATDLESSDADSVACSVGSCSIDDNYSNRFRLRAGHIEDADCNSSDAESFCPREDQEANIPLPTQEQLTGEIHRLELYAYRCTIEALHASGPLSWEQEALVTNLRLSLHISNDEHLMEWRNFAYRILLIRYDVFSRAKVGGLYTSIQKCSRMILGFAAFSWQIYGSQILGSTETAALAIWLLLDDLTSMVAFTVFRYFCKIQMIDQKVCGSRPCPALVRRTEEGWNHTNKAHAKASSDIRVR